MGDLSIAQDLLDGVVDALADLGDTRTLRIITVDPVDPLDPGAAPVETVEDVSVEALLFDFDKKYMPEANVIEGGTMALLSVDPLTDAQVEAIVPGNFLMDGSKAYDIVKTNPIEAAGVIVTVIVQLKG
jgi:hypothetical protein